jgi:pectate lyase
MNGGANPDGTASGEAGPERVIPLDPESNGAGSEGSGSPANPPAGAGNGSGDSEGNASEPSDDGDDPTPEGDPNAGTGGGPAEEPTTGEEPPDEEEPTSEEEPTNPDPGPVDCNVLPAPSPLEGWAAVAGNGVATTTGGGNATPIVVTTLAQLQNAVAGTAPAVVHVRGRLTPGDINVGSNKTIVGTCGAEIRGHVEIREAVNVIVRNVTIIGYGEGDCSLDPGFDSAVGCSSGDDAVIIQRNSHHVWFDHVAVRDGSDGNLDITNGANFVTISWTKFSYTPRTDNVGSDSTGAAGHRYSNLVGGTDSPDDFDDANSLNVTWHHNWWADNVVERQPRIRFGQNHLYNNYYSSLTSNYCIRAGIESQILLEGNAFEGSRDPHEFNNADDQTSANIALGAANLYTNVTGNQQTGGGGPAFTDPPYNYRLDPAAAVRAAVIAGAGPR